MPQRKKETSGKTRIVIIDDHPIVRRGIAQLIDQEPDLEVCGEADDAPQALTVIASLHPDLILVDITLKNSNGLDLIKQLSVKDEQPPALVVSMHDEGLYAERALTAGACGYVMKQEAAENVVRAIRAILKGDLFVSGKCGAAIVENFKKTHKKS